MVLVGISGRPEPVLEPLHPRRSGELLGKGGFGTVRVVTHKETKQKFALKVRYLALTSSHL